MDLQIFADPRFRRERIFLLIALPLTLLILVAAGVTLYFKSTEPPPPPEVLPTPTPYVKTAPDFIAEAKLAVEKGDYPAAKDALAHLTTDSEKSPSAWEIAGLINEKSGDPLAAFETYSKGIDANPSPGLHFRRAILYRNWGHLPASLLDISAANRLYPNDPLYTNELLLTRISLGEPDTVRQELTNLVSTGVNADTTGWIFPLAALALLQNQPSDAADALLAAKDAFPQTDFHTLLSHPAFAPYLNLPEILPLTFQNKEN